MSLLESLYFRVPVFVQNWMTTVRGHQIRKLRYTDYTWKTFHSLMESQNWSPEQFREYQERRLRRLAGIAFEHSPYYRERYREAGLTASDLANLTEVRTLPVILKQEFRKNVDRFVCTHVDRKQMWVSYTSGTTGTPLKAYHTPENVQERYAGLERLYHWYSPKPWRRRASCTGKLMVHPDNNRGPFHRMNGALRQQLFSGHHLTPENLDSYVRELKAFAPEQIDGIASVIYIIADHICRTGQEGVVRPNVVIPTSETLWPHLRERIEQAFQAPVANQYGSQEGAPLAYECAQGGFHTCPETGIFEILRPDDTPCAPGEYGRLVVTSFLTEGTPLIRYDIGDVAAWREGDCACGRKMPMLQSIEGRVDDMFFTEERGVVPRIDSAFKSMPSSIVAAQVAQVALDAFEVRIIPDPALYKAEQGQALAENLRAYVGNKVRIEVKIVEEIPRTSGGKLRAMVNECADPEIRSQSLRAWNRENAAPVA